VAYPNFFVVLIGFYGLFFLTYKLRDSAWGLVSTLALTGFMGYTSARSSTATWAWPTALK
jgi:modulator of FtsH protease